MIRRPPRSTRTDTLFPYTTLFRSREAEVVAAINAEHRNPLFLPGAALSPSLAATADLAELGDRDALLVVVPVPYLRAVLAELPASDAPLIFCSKGMEAERDRKSTRLNSSH